MRLRRASVTLDGNIVPRGTVAFHPVAGGPAAYARIEENGELRRFAPGAKKVCHRVSTSVTVTANEPPTVKQTATGRTAAARQADHAGVVCIEGLVGIEGSRGVGRQRSELGIDITAAGRLETTARR